MKTMKYFFLALIIGEEADKAFGAMCPHNSNARRGRNDIWMNSLPLNSDSTLSLSSFKDLMEEERLGDTGGF